jgi:hypothetical protein
VYGKKESEKMVAPNVKQRFDNAAVALEALKPIRVVGGATWQEILGYAIKPRTNAPVVGLLISCTWRLKPQLHKQNLPTQVTKPLILG